MAAKNAFTEALDQVKKLTQRAGAAAGGMANQAGGEINKAVSAPFQQQQFNSPVSNVQAYKPSPVVQNIQRVGRGVSNAIENVPRFNLPSAQISNPVGNFAVNQIARPIAQGILNTPSDFVQGNLRTGREMLRDTTSPFGLFTAPNTQQRLGDAAQVGGALLNVLPVGKAAGVAETLGKQSLKTALKDGALIGAGYGATQGALSGLQNNSKGTLKNQLGKSFLEGLQGAAVGGVTGGAFGGASYAIGQARSAAVQGLKSIFPKDTEEQLNAKAGKFLRDELGRFAKGGKGKGEPQFYGDLREQLGLSRTGNYEGGFVKIPDFLKPSKESIAPTVTASTPPGPAGAATNPTTTKTELPQSTLPGQEIPGGGQPNVPGSVSSPGSLPPEADPVQTIIAALKQSKPLEAKQAAIYSAARSKQAGAIAGIGKNIPGEAGFHAQLGQLKGELPKVQFESIRNQIKQPQIDSLFNMVENANLSPFEKVTAKSGLAKLLGAEGGSVPVKSELELLNQIFPPEFTQSILDKRPLVQKLFSLGEQALNLPRAMMATADLSAPLRQGVFLVGRPKQWAPAFGSMFKYAVSEKAYQGLQNDIRSRGTYPAMREAKLAITDMSPLLQGREEAFMSNLAEKIPVFGRITKGSERAYTGFLNKLRADTFDDLYKNAKTQGLLNDNPKLLSDIGNFVNTATGRGNIPALQRATTVLNGAFFSPRLMMSRLNLLNPVYYAQLDPFVRKEAIKSLLTFGGTSAAVLGLAKLGGADIGTDPRSADFGKIKVGNTRYDTLGGFSQYLRLAAQLITNQRVDSATGKIVTLGEGYKTPTRKDLLANFVESKQAPVLSFAMGLLKGQDSLGKPLNIPSEVLSRVIPLIVQDTYDVIRDKGTQGAGMALPGVFGVGVQTYGKQIPSLTQTPAGKPKFEYNNVPSLPEAITNKITGKQESNLSPEMQNKVEGLHKQQMKQDAIKSNFVLENLVPKIRARYPSMNAQQKVQLIQALKKGGYWNAQMQSEFRSLEGQ